VFVRWEWRISQTGDQRVAVSTDLPEFFVNVFQNPTFVGDVNVGTVGFLSVGAHSLVLTFEVQVALAEHFCNVNGRELVVRGHTSKVGVFRSGNTTEIVQIGSSNCNNDSQNSTSKQVIFQLAGIVSGVLSSSENDQDFVLPGLANSWVHIVNCSTNGTSNVVSWGVHDVQVVNILDPLILVVPVSIVEVNDWSVSELHSTQSGTANSAFTTVDSVVQWVGEQVVSQNDGLEELLDVVIIAF
jgi:hypothetical protein